MSKKLYGNYVGEKAGIQERIGFDGYGDRLHARCFDRNSVYLQITDGGLPIDEDRDAAEIVLTRDEAKQLRRLLKHWLYTGRLD